MIKSVAFFLGVFIAGLIGLLIVSGDLRRWITGEPTQEGMEVPTEVVKKTAGGGAPAGPPGGKEETNGIKVPIYDPLKGRLDYTIQGQLDDQALAKFQDIQELDSVILKNGQVDVPIYEDAAKELPGSEGEKKPRSFILTFARAEYTATFRKSDLPGIAAKERARETVRLLGGGDQGMGKLDDGSTFRFEELVFEIERKPGTENFFTIHSTKPVSIQNGYLRLESPTGLDGVVRNKGLQKLTFFPPVRTYLDPRSAKLFSLSGGEALPSSPPGQPPASKVAITCEGPLTFFLDLEPPTIRFEKEVLIYPLEGPEPERGAPPPAPGPTRFHCQLLVIDVDQKASPARPSRAVATWEGGRVQAHHEGRVMEGDRLTWRLIEGGQGEAILTGKPRLTGPEGWLEMGQIQFKLDEDRILLSDGLKGEFLTDAARPAGAGPPKGRAPRKKDGAAPGPKEGAGERKAEKASEATDEKPGPTEKLPERWEFIADDGELTFASKGEAGAPRADREGKAIGPRNLDRMVARSRKDDGLEIKSQGDGRFSLNGQVLTYDAAARTVTIDGSAVANPRFQHDGVNGTARSIQLRTEEGLVNLKGGVAIKIEDASALSPSAPPAKADGAQGAVEPGGSSSPKGEESISGPVNLLADEVDLRFDAGQRFLGAEARGKAQDSGAAAPVALESESPRYRLTGNRMDWDQVEQVASVFGPPHPCPDCSPQLVFEGGRLVAESLRFNRKEWRVNLLGHVDVSQCDQVGLGAAPDATPSRQKGKDSGFELSAARADVDLNENFKSDERVECGSSKELRKVKKIHAYEGPEEPILIRSQSYRGRAQEATWDSGPRELHIFGPGRQELTLYDSGKENNLGAKDIVYQCANELVVFVGDVKGDLRLEAGDAKDGEAPARERAGQEAPGAATVREDGLRHASAKAPRSEVLQFHFDANRMEVTVKETEKGLEPTTVKAVDKVLLRNEAYGILLEGDDLFYDHEKREVRIYSESGRYQKLTHTHPADEAPEPVASGAAPLTKVDQIESREIRLTYILDQSPARRNSPPSLDHIVVKFKDDVTATFFLPIKGEMPPGLEGGGPREEWKMQSDHLGIKLVPNKDRLRTVQLALAEGNVIFRSGDYMAIAQEAIYEETLKGGESLKKLRLRGDAQKPARLFNNASSPPPIARTKAELIIFKRGESNPVWVEQGSTEQLPLPVGIEELRREPKTR